MEKPGRTRAGGPAGPAGRLRPAPGGITAAPGRPRGARSPSRTRPVRGQAPARGRAPARASARPAARTSFVFLMIGLLGGGLLCVLFVNTVLATGSYQISALQQGDATLAQRVQALQERIATEESPAALARRAGQLGMVHPALLHFLNLTTHRIVSQPTQMPGVPIVPGYTP